MNQAELNVILEKHKIWFNGEEGGEKADSEGDYLVGANLEEAGLVGANLEGAILPDFLIVPIEEDFRG